MSHLVTALSAGKFFGQQGIEDDLVDRLHYIFTSGILIVFAVGVSWKQFGGHPIECSIPEQVPGIGVEQYVEMYCFAKDTYFVPWDSNIPLDEADKRKEELSYYQWVPFFLLAEALLFRVPCIFWKLVATHSGIKIHHLVQQASDERNIDVHIRANTVQMLTEHIDRALRYHRRADRRNLSLHTCRVLMDLPYSAAYVAMMYLTTKLMYLATVIFSFLWLNKFLLKSDQDDYFGAEAMHGLWNGTRNTHPGLFPRVTICDFPVRTLGQVQHYSIQCALIINLLNEKIFMFLWCWYVILALLTILSFIFWAAVALLPCFRRWFIVRHLEMSDVPIDTEESAVELERFLLKYLHVDGAFILRVVTAHAGVVMGTELTISLWKNFYGFPQAKNPEKQGGSTKKKASTKDSPKKKNVSILKDTHKTDSETDEADQPDEPGDEQDDILIPDFTKSPIYMEEKDYERKMSEIRRRKSLTASDVYVDAQSAACVSPARTAYRNNSPSKALLTAIAIPPPTAPKPGGRSGGDGAIGERLMMIMHDANNPSVGQTAANAADPRTTDRYSHYF